MLHLTTILRRMKCPRACKLSDRFLNNEYGAWVTSVDPFVKCSTGSRVEFLDTYFPACIMCVGCQRAGPNLLHLHSTTHSPAGGPACSTTAAGRKASVHSLHALTAWPHQGRCRSTHSLPTLQLDSVGPRPISHDICRVSIAGLRK